MIDKQTYVWYSITFPEREKIKYTVNRYVILGWSMHDDAPGPLKGVSHIRASDKALAPKPCFGGRPYAIGTGLIVRGPYRKCLI